MPRDVGCPSCGRRFFQHSLPIHLPQCQAKRNLVEVPCQYCDRLVRSMEMADHERKCPRRPQDGFGKGFTKGATLPAFKSSMRPSSSAASLRRDRSAGSFGAVSTPVLRKQGFASSRNHVAGKNIFEDSAASSPPLKKKQPPYMPPPPGQGDDRVRCAVCKRGFAADRIGAHQQICRKVAAKKQRRSYDGSAVRRKRIAEENGVRHIPAASTVSSQGRKPARWRQDHAAFVAMVRDAKRMTAAERRGVPAQAIRPSRAADEAYQHMTSGFVPCPYCSRSFSDQAAQRHIPQCKYIVNKPRAPPAARNNPRGAPTTLRDNPPPTRRCPPSSLGTSRRQLGGRPSY